jgi:serine/threonine-protein kinase
VDASIALWSLDRPPFVRPVPRKEISQLRPLALRVRYERAMKPLVVPQPVGRYTLLGELARGGMSVVYVAAAHGAFGRRLVAVKELNPSLVEDAECREMFLREAHLATRLAHPNIVRTYDAFSEDERLFLVMEYLEGRTLSEFRRRLGVELPIAIHLRALVDVARGLHYVHELCDGDGSPLSAVHRDVSPQNVVVTFDGRAKLIDFGITKVARWAACTGNDCVKGKLAYMAPEQARMGPIDRRTDIFAMGVMLWEAITGRRLWEGVASGAQMERLAAGDLPLQRATMTAMPAELRAILSRALAPEPEARFESARDLAYALDVAIARLYGPTPSREVGRVASDEFAFEMQLESRLVSEQLERFVEGEPPRTISGTRLSALRLDRASGA